MHEIRPRLAGACSIDIGPAELTPAASHLFALLLVLVLSPRESWTRRHLQELLFADADDGAVSHRLRQLLYRLRALGVTMEEQPNGLLRILNPVADPLDDLAADGGSGDESGIAPAPVLAH